MISVARSPKRRLVALAAMAALLWEAGLCSAQPATGQQMANPDLFKKSLEFAYQALEQYGRWNNPQELKRVNDIGYQIALHSGYTSYPFTFHLINMPVPNAFALPAGQIFITRGMMELGLDDDMLAGLLGHEIAHVTEEHFLKMRKKATLLNILSQALMVGVVLGTDSKREAPSYDPYGIYGSTDNRGDLIQGAAAASLVVSELLLRSYSREHEDEADDEGQRFSAAAGYDPGGTRQLMAKMELNLPQSKNYGYWQTHPFFEQRVIAAEARSKLLTIQTGKEADAYREKTQQLLLAFSENSDLEPWAVELLREQALVAWPQGSHAEELRLAKLHKLRDETLERKPLDRDLGRLIEAYWDQLREVAELTPESPLLPALRQEIAEFRVQMSQLYPQAATVVRTGVYGTPFLETFLSNFPDSAEASQVALALGDSYSRLSRQADAVAHYLKAWQVAPESEEGKRAREGLRRLAPMLNQLGAVQRLIVQDEDLELQELAQERMEELASTYNDLSDGAAYLREYPNGAHADRVTARLNALAEKLYAEVVLYQGVGENVKALERVNRILTYAPLSPAAERLRERAVLES